MHRLSRLSKIVSGQFASGISKGAFASSRRPAVAGPSCSSLRMAIRRFCLLLLAAGVATVSSSAMAQSAIETDSSNNTGYTVPSTAQNLLSAASTTLSANPSVPSNFNGENTNNTSYAPLVNGSFGAVGSLDPTTVAISNGNTLTYSMGGSPGGYTISEIDTFSGWQDSGRIDQTYQIFYTTATNNTLQR